MKPQPFWSPQTLEWYLRASAYEDYHAKTAALLAPYVADGTVCSLGCGPGRLTLALLRHIPRITALDCDPMALDALRRDGAAFPGLEILEADAMTLPKERCWDHLILSFFGKITAEGQLSYFLAHCRRQLISIVNAAPKSSFSSTGSTARMKDYAPQVTELLTRQGLPFSYLPLTLDFGQPLRDLEDARAFIRQYSPPDCPPPDDCALLDRLSPLPEGGFYLPHRKEIGIFIIRKESYI